MDATNDATNDATKATNAVWRKSFSQRVGLVTSSIIRDLLHLTERPSVISFGGGLPAPECFPAEELQAASEKMLVEKPLDALQYGPTEGYRPLRELVARYMQQRSMTVSFEQVLITSGSQQALDLLGRLLIDAGSTVLVEDPTYLGALQSWRPHNPQFVTVPVDEQGIDVAALERLLAAENERLRPRFLYTMPSFQNPTGVTLTPERRRALVQLAARYQLPIIEDDAYGELYYTGSYNTPLAAYDMELHGELRHVVYISTFSKLLSPGMRTAWTIAPTGLLGKIAHIKQGIDLHTNSLSQAIVYAACADGLLERHVPGVRDIYRERRDTMLAALAEHMPGGVRWTVPTGGMFIWLTLPPQFDSLALLHKALEYDVAFVPGTCFYANGGGENTIRLNFSGPSPAQIIEGIGRLGRMFRAVAQHKAA